VSSSERLLDLNRNAWNIQSRANQIWSVPVNQQTIDSAKQGNWQVILTPTKPVPGNWFGTVANKGILCLASGGGQQVPVLAAAGAHVTSFDLSDEQLKKDLETCRENNLDVVIEQGNMQDLSRFADASFDLIFHPCCNVFIPDPMPVWRECFRVLKEGGRLLTGFVNPVVYLFDHNKAQETGQLVVVNHLPYSDLIHLSAEQQEAKVLRGEPLEFGHTLEEQIGGQLSAGFLLADMYEDGWFDQSWLLPEYTSIAVATLAIKSSVKFL